MDLIHGTDHADKLEEYKSKRQIETKDGQKVSVGKSWYKGFMKQNKQVLKRGRFKIKDQKCCPWCTCEHFSNMYYGVY
jgi:hypothetical protein